MAQRLFRVWPEHCSGPAYRMHHSGRVVELLLVGESPDAARVAAETSRNGRNSRRITVARDPAEALRILANRPRPDLILLLADAQHNGAALLEEVKGDPGLRHIPVMVVGDSEDGDDVERAYNQHANCYIRKPAGEDGLAEVMRSIERFWLGIVTLPPR